MSKPLSVLTPEQILRLKFIERTNLLVRGKGKCQTVHTVGYDAFNKLETFLSGGSPVSVLKEGMKVFIVPDGSVSGSNITAVCKNLKLKVTTDLDKAQVIIGNNNLKRNFQYKESLINIKLGLLENVSVVSLSKWSVDQFYKYMRSELALYDEDLPELTSNDTVLFGRGTVDVHYPTGLSNYNVDGALLVSDSILNIVYHALNKKLPVVNDFKLFEALEKVVLTEDSFEMLSNMYESSDRTDRTTANEILFNCDYQKSKFYIWKLWQDHKWKIIKSSKTKMYDSFYDACESFLGEDEDSFIILAAKENILLEYFYNEYIQKELSILEAKLEYSSSYVSCEIKPKFTYQEFLNHYQNVNQSL